MKAAVGSGFSTISLQSLLEYGNVLVNLLDVPADFPSWTFERHVLFRHVREPILSEPVVIATALATEARTALTVRNWGQLSRDFVNFYGTVYYPSHRGAELSRISRETTAAMRGGLSLECWGNLSRALLWQPSSGVITVPLVLPKLGVVPLGITVTRWVIGPAVRAHFVDSPFARGAMADGAWSFEVPESRSGTSENTFPWSYAEIARDVGRPFRAGNRDVNTHLSQRWIKAYTVNPKLTEIAAFLGMRGAESAAAVAPWMYLSYLQMYGVGRTLASDLNPNPTRFKSNIFNAVGIPLFSPGDNPNIPNKEQVESDIRENTWLLLHPTRGGEYRRRWFSAWLGDIFYSQYNAMVFGGNMDYRRGGVMQLTTGSPTGFLRFPSLEDNIFTARMYDIYAIVALWLLGIGIIFILTMGIFRKRKASWMLVAIFFLVCSVIVVPFINDIASRSMDALVGRVLQDRLTVFSLTEMLSDQQAASHFESRGFGSEAADIAASIAQDLSIVFADRNLMLRQDITRKVLSLGNFQEFQGLASTRWMLPSILRQFTAEGGNRYNFLYVPMIDVMDNAANAYWWYNPPDRRNSGGRNASRVGHQFAVGTSGGHLRIGEEGVFEPENFYPNFHALAVEVVPNEAPFSVRGITPDMLTSYRSLTQEHRAGSVAPVHDFIYVLNQNAFVGGETNPTSRPLLDMPLRRAVDGNENSSTFWGNPSSLGDTLIANTYLGSAKSTLGGANTFVAAADTLRRGSYFNGVNVVHGAEGLLHSETGKAPRLLVLGGSDVVELNEDGETVIVDSENAPHTFWSAHLRLVARSQQYNRNDLNTMMTEFNYIWSTESAFPYFYALVKETMAASGEFSFTTGRIDTAYNDESTWGNNEQRRMGTILNGLQGRTTIDGYFGASRVNFMFQGGLCCNDLSQIGSHIRPTDLNPVTGVRCSTLRFTGYSRDVLDLESMFYNMVPYMYQMTILTGGLTGDHENDLGMFGRRPGSGVEALFTRTEFHLFDGLPHSFMYRSNWVVKIAEAPAFNRPETIGYWHKQADGEWVKRAATVTMTWFPDAYLAVTNNQRVMVFSEAQMHAMGLHETDLTTFELRAVRLNQDISARWTRLLNYVTAGNTSAFRGMSSEVLVRQMAMEALIEFNRAFTPPGFGNAAYALYPTSVDLRNVSFDTLMRVIMLNATRDASYFHSDAMYIALRDNGIGVGLMLWLTTLLNVYVLTLLRAFFLAALFLIGVIGVARGVFASNNAKKSIMMGYLVNIGILWLASLGFYMMFRWLMAGAGGTELVGSRVAGAASTPMWSLSIIFVAGLVYTGLMVWMMIVNGKALWYGTNDMGLGAYKEVASKVVEKTKSGINRIRTSNRMEEAAEKNVGGGDGSGSVQTRAESNSNRSRRGNESSATGTGSGARALEGADNSGRDRPRRALEDSDAVNNAIDRGGAGTPQNAARDLEAYSQQPSDNAGGGT
jgi:hypothetical protein